MRIAPLLLVACSASPAPVTNASPPAGQGVHPIFVVPEIGGNPFLLACSIGGKLVDGKACAKQLSGELDYDLVTANEPAIKVHLNARFELGFPCPGPADMGDGVNRADQPFVNVQAPRNLALIVPAGTKFDAGHDFQLWKPTGRPAALVPGGGDERHVVGIVDLDGQRLVVVRATELYTLHTPDGTRLPGEVGCYFGG